MSRWGTLAVAGALLAGGVWWQAGADDRRREELARVAYDVCIAQLDTGARGYMDALEECTRAYSAAR